MGKSRYETVGMNGVVLDSSAVIALLLNEPGAEKVSCYEGHTAMSAINLAEVCIRMVEIGVAEDKIRQFLSAIRVQVYPFDVEQAYAVSKFRNLARKYGMSLADCACIQLGKQLNLPVVTGDRAWTRVDLGVEVDLIRD